MKTVSQYVAVDGAPASRERETVLDVWYTGAGLGRAIDSDGLTARHNVRETVRFSHASVQGVPLSGVN